jgi:hypothetical protein
MQDKVKKHTVHTEKKFYNIKEKYIYLYIYIEHHRIMGMLSNPRLDEGSKENLMRRKKKLEDLGLRITNKMN